MSNLINSIDQVILENDLPFEWSDKINKELKDISPNKTLKRVDLPAPFGPMIVNISPLSTVKETSFNAFTPPKDTVIFFTSNKLIKPYPI